MEQNHLWMSPHTIKTKINSRCIIDLNTKTIKGKNKKVLEKKTGEYL